MTFLIGVGHVGSEVEMGFNVSGSIIDGFILGWPDGTADTEKGVKVSLTGTLSVGLPVVGLSVAVVGLSVAVAGLSVLVVGLPVVGLSVV